MPSAKPTPLPAGFSAELLLTDAETARLLRITPDGVRTLHRTKQLRGVKVGAHLRWKPASVTQFVGQLEPEK